MQILYLEERQTMIIMIYIRNFTHFLMRMAREFLYGTGSHNDNRSNETKEGKPRRKCADSNAHPVPSVAQNRRDLQSKPRRGKKHTQMVTPLEEADWR
jgi:hypothetical protein